jgi:DNA-binding MarR family transcriptional regulator
MFEVLNEVGIVEQLSRNRFEAAMADGLKVPHFAVLNHLVRLGDGKSLKSLARAFQLSKGAMTNTVQRLAARGLVRVEADPADRRGKRVFLTAAGRARREAAIATLSPDLAALAAALGPAEAEVLRDGLEALRRLLDAMRDPPQGGAAEPGSGAHSGKSGA